MAYLVISQSSQEALKLLKPNLDARFSFNTKPYGKINKTLFLETTNMITKILYSMYMNGTLQNCHFLCLIEIQDGCYLGTN